jgi:hypothetical protein
VAALRASGRGVEREVNERIEESIGSSWSKLAFELSNSAAHRQLTVPVTDHASVRSTRLIALQGRLGRSRSTHLWPVRKLSIHHKRGTYWS